MQNEDQKRYPGALGPGSVVEHLPLIPKALNPIPNTMW